MSAKASVIETALAAARLRAGQDGMAGRAGFRNGSFEATGLPGGSAQAVMSDALLFAPRKDAAAAELAVESGEDAGPRVTTAECEERPSMRFHWHR
jgi:hypothetical protein